MSIISNAIGAAYMSFPPLLSLRNRSRKWPWEWPFPLARRIHRRADAAIRGGTETLYGEGDNHDSILLSGRTLALVGCGNVGRRSSRCFALSPARFWSTIRGFIRPPEGARGYSRDAGRLFRNAQPPSSCWPRPPRKTPKESGNTILTRCAGEESSCWSAGRES